MPPKKPGKAAQAPAPAEVKKAKPKPPAVKKPTTPRKKKEDGTIDFTTLPAKNGEGQPPAPIEVQVSGDPGRADEGSRGDFQKILRLRAPGNFSLAKTVVIEDGEYAGYQAIYMKPSKPFDFSKLPDEARNRVYRQYFACKGVPDDPIVFDGKRSSTKEAYAKAYAEGSKNRVALLATSKEIYKEAARVFYAKNLRFENTQVLIDFLSQLIDARPLLRSVEVNVFNKATARTALAFLAEARGIDRLHFDKGVFSEGDPKKAAKAFCDLAFRFLKSVGGSKVEGETRDDAAGVEVLSFGSGAFTLKEGKELKYWDQEMVEEFKEELRKKMRSV